MHPCWKHRIVGWTAAAVSLLASGVPAQYVTVPAAADFSANVPGIGELGGISRTVRQQFLVGPDHLQALIGHRVTEIWFRRDGAHSEPLQGGSFDLELRLSQSAVDPAAPSPDFAANHGVPAPPLVFAGRVTVGASPALSGSPWSLQNTIRIVLAQPFAYTGGSLCLDIVGRVVPGQESPFWPIEYQASPRIGAVQELGTSCSGFARGQVTASGSQRMLAAGSTASFDAFGTASAPGLFMLSGVGYPGGIDLSSIGAAGCRLYPVGGITLGVTFGAPIGHRGDGPGGATVHVQLPADPAIMGASVYVQWLTLEIGLPVSERSNPLGISLSNGVQATISALPPELGLATITSNAFSPGGPVPRRGYVDTRKGPVLRFLHD